jgi:hypothetical protein
MTKLEQINQVFAFDYKTTMRIKKEDAKDILLNNRSFTTAGSVRYFVIRDLGLGVCEIGLRGPNDINTFFVSNVEHWLKERKWTTL